MIKALKLICFLVLLKLDLFSQQVKVKWGQPVEAPKKTYVAQTLGEYEGKTYLLRKKISTLFSDSEYYIEQYSSDYFLEKTTLFPLPKVKGADGVLQEMFLVKGQLLTFISFFEKDSNRHTAYVLKQAVGSVTPSEFKAVDEIIASKKNNKGEFSFVLAQDSSKVLIYHRSPFENGGKEKLSYKLFNINAEELWSRKVELPYLDKAFGVSGFIVDINENVYMLARINDEQQRWSRDKTGYRYNILALFKDDPVIKEYDVSLPDKSISDIKFRLGTKGDLIAAGFYSNRARTESEIAGTFFLRIDIKSKQVTATGVKDFEKEFLTQFMSERKVRKGNELYSYIINNIIVDSTGGATVSAEQYYESTICSTDPRTGIMRCNYYYYYNDIIVVKVAPTGSILWTKKIPKRQVSANDDGPYSSYLLVPSEDNLYIIFNDNPRNLAVKEQDQARYMSNYKKSVTVLVSLGSGGEMKKEPLFSAKDHSVILRPSVSYSLKPSEALLFGQKRKTYKLGKLFVEK